jgi:hypothetical protein
MSLQNWCCLVSVVCTSGAIGVRNSPADAPKSDIQKLLAATKPQQAKEINDRVFARASSDLLKRLKQDASANVAVRAAWEQVRRTVPETPGPNHVQPNPKKVERFLGFLEGRSHLSLPDWWQRALRSMVAYGRDSWSSSERIESARYPDVSYPDTGIRTKAIETEKRTVSPFPILAPPNTRVTRLGNNFELRNESRRALVPMSLLQDYAGRNLLEPTLTPTECFLALRSYGSDCEYPLVAIDSQSGQVRWKSVVWGQYSPVGSSGTRYYRVSILLDEQRVIVLGAGTDGAHIEAFRRDTGASIFRFSTSY